MASSKITLYSFIKYMKDIDDDLFGGLTLPTGYDKDILIDSIILRGGEFEVLYSDPFFMKEAVTAWGKKWYGTLDRWYTAYNQEYSPIENYDRHENWTDIGTGSNSSQQTGSTSDSSTMSGTDNTEHKVSAYDSNVYSPSSKDEETIGNTASGSSTVNNNITGSTSESNTHTGHLHGNIGVTTNQQMIEAEIRLYRDGLYDMVTDLFLSEMIIPIY